MEQMPAVLRSFRDVTVRTRRTVAVVLSYQFSLPQIPEPVRGKAFGAVAAVFWVLTPVGNAAGAARSPVGAGHDGPGPMSDLGQITAEPLDPTPAMDHSMFRPQ
jgi:hypothetical protein